MIIHHPHTYSIDELLEKLKSKTDGISDENAKQRQTTYGKNVLPEKPPPSALFTLLKQFNNFFVYILLLAAIISYVASEKVDTYVILIIVIINAIIGFILEFRAEKSIKALSKLTVRYAKVIREGNIIKIDAQHLVPGDVILIEAGDYVPADARLLHTQNLSCVEASLTGESAPILKNIEQMPENTPLADRKNMVWMGTYIVAGSGKAVIISIGSQTELGKIALSLESIEKNKNHFEEKTDMLVKQMGIIAFIGAVITFISGYFIQQIPLPEISFFAIATLVSAIPEGLPIIMVIVLAIGAHRMSKRNVIIRKLSAAETLCVTNVIMTDKTGTLTQNIMSVEEIYLPPGQSITVTSEGWSPKGSFYYSGNPIETNEFPLLNLFISIAGNVSPAQINEQGDGQFEVIGDPTEAALIVLAQKANHGTKEKDTTLSKVDEMPFNQELKARAMLLYDRQQQKTMLYVAGAPETILERSSYAYDASNCPVSLTEKNKERHYQVTDEIAQKAMRTIALAFRELPNDVITLDESLLIDLTFIGIAGIKDPVRPGIKESIEMAHQAGIRVIMATGDHKTTAMAISKEIQLIVDDTSNIMTGSELERLTEAEFSSTVKTTNVFARLTPEMKLRIARELQIQGNTIAMTGDGVNDAPALKMADIGIAMGLSGTDVARESSELVLTDDNFVSIINAVEEARIIFNNIRRTTYFLVTTNIAELFTVISTIILGLPLPLLPTQILWLNLVTDGVLVIALSMEPGHSHILETKPNKRSENIITKNVIPYILIIVTIMAVSTILVFQALLPYGISTARTGAFVVMSMTQIFNVFNMRSMKLSAIALGLFSNAPLNWAVGASFLLILSVLYFPPLMSALEFESIQLLTFLLLVLISSTVWISVELYKFMQRKSKLS
ncbi:cation-transporting P-type ATPase [candidate division WWE3 bacterium]|nr:cation-transporting P-type ATPase [candidate division WWE3 bacterium]